MFKVNFCSSKKEFTASKQKETPQRKTPKEVARSFFFVCIKFKNKGKIMEIS